MERRKKGREGGSMFEEGGREGGRKGEGRKEEGI